MSLEEKHGKVLSEENIQEIIQRSRGWALMNGVQMSVINGDEPEKVEAEPCTLFPSIIPKAVLNKAKSLQTTFQTILYRAANDHTFMIKCFESVVKVDRFVEKLWNIYTIVKKEGTAQKVSLLLSRNDFMMEEDCEDSTNLTCKQVEINTIAAGCGNVTEVHKYSLALAGIPYDDSQIASSDGRVGFAKGLVKAWELYQNKQSVILFVVVSMPESSTPTQRLVEKYIYEENRSIKVMYRTFAQLRSQISIGDNSVLTVDGMEVAVVYYRHGYSPEHYPTDDEFKLRLDIERSLAIKCPTVAYQLIGCKKAQQYLAEPGVLERYLDNSDVTSEIRSTFVGLYRLDGENSEKIISEALTSPGNFVLKPNREGGGNNLFGAKLKDFLMEVKDKPEKSSWILMDRIRAAVHRNRLVRPDIRPDIRNVVSELGITGVHISTPDEEIENFECGYMMRTKPVEMDEGGVCHGHACVDSIFLCDKSL